MTEVVLRHLADLFRDAATAHHKAFAATNGADDEWPTWYAAFLAPRLREALGRPVPAAELARWLRAWDGDHRNSGSAEPWPEFYARSLLTLRDPGN